MYRQLLVAVIGYCSYAFVNASTANVDSRIVGGNNVTFNACTHVVAIRLINGDFLCNGVLITPHDVLTAASCVLTDFGYHNVANLLVVAGTILNSPTSPGAVTLSVLQYWITNPPGLNPVAKYADVAVLRLNRSLSETAAIKIAAFGITTPPINWPCSICGWGANTTFGRPATILQTLTINVQPKTSPNCTRAAGGAVPELAFCAGNPLQAGSGACTGDIGAPLMCNGALHGILTNTGGCGALHDVSIFADAVANGGWIRNRTSLGIAPPNNDKPGNSNGPGGSAQASLKLGMMVIAVLTAFMLR